MNVTDATSAVTAVQGSMSFADMTAILGTAAPLIGAVALFGLLNGYIFSQISKARRRK